MDIDSIKNKMRIDADVAEMTDRARLHHPVVAKLLQLTPDNLRKVEAVIDDLLSSQDTDETF